MTMPTLLTPQLTHCRRRAAPCLLLGCGCVLTTVLVYGGQFVLSEIGCLAGVLGLVVYSTRAQRAARYPQAFGAALVASLGSLGAAVFAGLIAASTLLTAVDARQVCISAASGCLGTGDGVLAGLDLAGAALMAGVAALYAAGMARAIWRFGPTAAAAYRDRSLAVPTTALVAANPGPAVGGANLWGGNLVSPLGESDIGVRGETKRKRG